MTSRVVRSTAAILSILLLSGVPTQAAPVAISQVLQVLGNYQNPPELRLRTVSQNTNSLMDEGYGALQVTSAARKSAAGAGEILDATIMDITSGDTLLSGVAVSANPQGVVDVVDQGGVQGTICDCGEITVPGGVPKWPLLFLAAIPFFFIHGDNSETPTPLPPIVIVPTPIPPTIPQVPEPTSLLLFGSGLVAFGAGLRRRFANRSLTARAQTTEEG